MEYDSRPVRLGIIGAGIFAREAHVPSIQALDDTFEVVAVFSRTEQSADKLVGQLHRPVDVYHDIAALLERDDIEAVDIVLPIPLQPRVVQMALAAGKHVISEKPVAPTVAAGQELVKAYRQYAGQVWMVAENYRYEAPFVRAAEIVRSGEIGRVLMADWAIYVPMRPDNKYFKTDWRQESDYPGGYLLDGGVHHIAGLRYVLGEVESVMATVVQQREDLPPADTLSASLRFDSGAVVAYSVTYAAGAPWYGNLQVVGEKGALRISRADALEVTVEGETSTIEVVSFRGVEGELAAFAAAIREDRVHRNSPREALQDVAVMEAILLSGETGQRVSPARIVG